MIQSDAAFVIGKTHRVCQDYAVTGSESDSLQSVWLADGCSSSPHTDIGARFLTHGMRERIADFQNVVCGPVSNHHILLDGMVRANIVRSECQAKRLGLPGDCVDATLLGLVAENGCLHAALYGDGALAYGRNDGSRIVYRLQYLAGYPFYPVYLATPNRFSQWQQVAENQYTLTKTVLEENGNACESETFHPHDRHHLVTRPVAGLRWAAVLSDGVESFQQRAGSDTSSSFTPVDYLDVIRQLTAFKNFTGAFVHRRVQAFEKECTKQGWHHNDDIAVAAMYFGNPGQEN